MTAVNENLATGEIQGIEKWSSKRRDFLRMLGYGAGAAALSPMLAACGGANASSEIDSMRRALVTDADFWTKVENMFVLSKDKVHMNIGTGGSMPQRVLDVFAQKNLEKSVTSGSGYGNLRVQRDKVAKSFGVDGDELAFSANTSSGMCHAILGLDWKEGDVILTTNHEHGGGNTPMNIARDRYGVQIERVILPVGNNQNAATYQNLFDEKIRELKLAGKRVRAMVWSCPTYLTGTILPIAELMEVVKEHGLISIVDGAHLPGMMHYDYGALGVDFMAGAGHKWQCGPGSTGILVIRNKIRASNPLPLPKWFPVHTSTYSTKDRNVENFDIAASVTACGSVHTPMFDALVDACDMWDEIGRKKIETYGLAMSSYLKEKVAEKWGIDALYAPKDDPKLLSALTSFNPFLNKDDVMDSGKATTYLSNLKAAGFEIRTASIPVIGYDKNHNGLRISTHLWHDADDIDSLVDTMWDLSKKMA